MIDYRLKYQASIFLNALDMGATPKNISDMMGDFSDKGFIPNIFQEINLHLNHKIDLACNLLIMNGELTSLLQELM